MSINCVRGLIKLYQVVSKYDEYFLCWTRVRFFLCEGRIVNVFILILYALRLHSVRLHSGTSNKLNKGHNFKTTSEPLNSGHIGTSHPEVSTLCFIYIIGKSTFGTPKLVHYLGGKHP